MAHLSNNSWKSKLPNKFNRIKIEIDIIYLILHTDRFKII